MKIEKTTEILTTKLKLLIVAGITLLLLPLISMLTDPLFLAVKYVTRIADGSPLFDLLHREMEGAFVYCYLFNVTNAEAFLSGEDDKLRVQEVGPFTYQEFRSNDDIELDTDKGVMRFTPRTRAQFVPEKSVADPRGFNLTLPNVATLAISTGVSAYPYFTKVAFDILIRRLRTQSISHMDAHSFLWGYEEPLVSLAHTVMPGYIQFNKMGVMDQTYNKPPVRLEMAITTDDKFEVKNIDGIRGLPARGYSIPSKRSRCNTFVNTYEGFGYPPGLTPKTPIRVYRDMFCRFLDLDFVDTKTMEYGPEAFRYKLSNTTYSTSTENECLCKDNHCIKGVTDLSSCFYGLNLASSNGHFLHADPKLYERIEGIHPDEEEHGSEFIVDPKLGFALETKFTIQLNVVMDNSSTNPIFKPFANMVVPIAYSKIVQAEIKEDIKMSYKIVYVYAPYVLHAIEILSAVTGLGIAAYVARCILNKYLTPNQSIYFQVTQDEKDSPLIGNINIAMLEKRFGSNDEDKLLRRLN